LKQKNSKKGLDKKLFEVYRCMSLCPDIFSRYIPKDREAMLIAGDIDKAFRKDGTVNPEKLANDQF
jgi:hypothetical protein